MFQVTTSLRIPPPYLKDTNFPLGDPRHYQICGVHPQMHLRIPLARHRIRHLRRLQMVTTTSRGTYRSLGRALGIRRHRSAR